MVNGGVSLELEEDLMQSLSLALDGVTQETNRRREAYLRRSVLL